MNSKLPHQPSPGLKPASSAARRVYRASVYVVTLAWPLLAAGCKRPPTVRTLALGPGQGCAALSAERELYCWGQLAGGVAAKPRLERETEVDQIAFGADGSACMLQRNRVRCRGSRVADVAAWNDVPALAGANEIAVSAREVCGLLRGASAAAAGTAFRIASATPARDVLACVPAAELSVAAPSATRQLADVATLAFGGTALWLARTDGHVDEWTPAGPVRVAHLEQASQVAASATHACAVRADGSVACWGSNAFGQLGKDVPSDLPAAVAVNGLSGVANVGCGDGFTCALLKNGTVSCLGDNRKRQLATSGIESSAAPVPVFGVLAANGLAVAGAGACIWLGMREGARCWGDNHNSQLGNSAKELSGVPMPVKFP